MDERRAYALDWEDVVTGIRLVESVTNVFPGGGGGIVGLGIFSNQKVTDASDE